MVILAPLALPFLFLSFRLSFPVGYQYFQAEFSFFCLKLPFISCLPVGYWYCHVPSWPRKKFQAPLDPPFMVGPHVHLPACTAADIALKRGAPGYQWISCSHSHRGHGHWDHCSWGTNMFSKRMGS